jgi:hypothetical protein
VKFFTPFFIISIYIAIKHKYIMNIVEYAVRLKDEFSAQIQKINASTKKTDDAVKNIKNSADKASGAFNGLKGAIAGAFGIAAITAFGMSIVKRTAEVEKLKAVLKQSMGDAAGTKAFDDITEYSKTSTNSVVELLDAYKKLNSQGFTPTMAEMKKMEDLSNAQGKSFDQLAEAILDAKTGEYTRLKELGIVIRAGEKGAGDVVKATFRGVTTEVGKSDEAMKAYLISLGEINGVKGATDAIAETLAGRLAMLNNKWDAMQLTLGEELRPAIMWTVDALMSMIDWVTVASRNISSFVTWVKESQTGLTILGTLLMGLATPFLILNGALKAYAIYQAIAATVTGIMTGSVWALNAALLANPLFWIPAAIAAVVAALVYAYKKFEWFRVGIHGVLGVVGNLVDVIKGLGVALMGLTTWNPLLIAKGLKMANDAIKKGWDDGVAGAPKAPKSEDKPETTGSNTPTNPNNTKTPIIPKATTAEKKVNNVSGSKPTTLIINIDKLIEKYENHFNSTSNSPIKLKHDVEQILIGVVNDVNRYV